MTHRNQALLVYEGKINQIVPAGCKTDDWRRARRTKHHSAICDGHPDRDDRQFMTATPERLMRGRTILAARATRNTRPSHCDAMQCYMTDGQCSQEIEEAYGSLWQVGLEGQLVSPLGPLDL